MSYLAHYGAPTTSPPLQLGGATTDCFLSGSEVVFASITATGHSANVTMYSWDPDQQYWFIFPVDPVLVDPAVNGGHGMQRYVTGKDPQGAYFTFVTDQSGEGTFAIVSIRLADGQ